MVDVIVKQSFIHNTIDAHKGQKLDIPASTADDLRKAGLVEISSSDKPKVQRQRNASNNKQRQPQETKTETTSSDATQANGEAAE